MAEERNFFTDGAAYERLMGRWSAPAGDIFLEWLAPAQGLRWLDVGCGNGAFTERLVARCAPAAVEGIDPSQDQIAFARIRPGARPAQFRQGDAQALPFADASFDAAAMALVITFIPDPAKAVAEMARVVRPGGSVATYMWDIPGGGLPLEPFQAALRSIGVAYPNPPGFAASQQDEMRALWQRAGLEAIDTRVIRIAVSYADFEDFWESNTAPVGPAGKAVRDLSPALRDQLKTLLRAQLVKDPAGRITYEAHANAVKGRVPG